MSTLPDHRVVETKLRVLDAEGAPLRTGGLLHIVQTRHDFLFGSNMFAWRRNVSEAENRAYEDHLGDLFNYVSLPFYWGDNSDNYPWDRAYEPEEGQLNDVWLTKMATWCGKRQITVKGHPLMFARVPPWVESLSLEALERHLWARISREVRTFRGLIDLWDVVNEPAQMVEKADWLGGSRTGELYQLRGAVNIIKRAFDLARAANPDAVLVLNDWDTSDRFYNLTARCLDAGAPIDAIGLQYHELEHYGGPEQAWEVCERFAKLGLPLHFTELMVPSGNAEMRAAFDWQRDMADWVSTEAGEQRQAREVVELYSVLFSHPAVAAITWWDLSDQGSYRGTPTGLLRHNMTPKPAYLALHDLIRGAWWTDTEVIVGEGGVVPMTGAKGDYQVTTRDAERALIGEFSLYRKSPELIEVRLANST